MSRHADTITLQPPGAWLRSTASHNSGLLLRLIAVYPVDDRTQYWVEYLTQNERCVSWWGIDHCVPTTPTEEELASWVLHLLSQ